MRFRLKFRLSSTISNRNSGFKAYYQGVELLMKFPLSLKHYEVMKSMYVGIDVSKRTPDVCLKGSDKEQFFKIENKSNSIKKLFKELSTVDSRVLIAMENTGHYNHQLYKVLPDFNFTVYVVDSKHIKRSNGFARGKNDKVDAKRIATFIERNNEDLDPWKPLWESGYSLKVLFTERKAEVARMRSLKQKIEGLNQQKISQFCSIAYHQE